MRLSSAKLLQDWWNKKQFLLTLQTGHFLNGTLLPAPPPLRQILQYLRGAASLLGPKMLPELLQSPWDQSQRVIFSRTCTFFANFFRRRFKFRTSQGFVWMTLTTLRELKCSSDPLVSRKSLDMRHFKDIRKRPSRWFLEQANPNAHSFGS